MNKQARDNEREALDYAIRVPISALGVEYRPLWRLIRAIQDSVWEAGFRKHPEPVITEACAICGWSGPRTQYLGDREDNIAVAHPDGDHRPDWLPRLRAVSGITDAQRIEAIARKIRFRSVAIDYDDHPAWMDLARAVLRVPVGEGDQ